MVHPYSTLLPRMFGRLPDQRLAQPLHGTLTPARISPGCPPCVIPQWGTGTGPKYHCPRWSHGDTACHRLFCGRMDPLGTLLAVIDEWFQSRSICKTDILPACPFTGGLGASSSVACPVQEPHQECNQVIGYSLFKEHKGAVIISPHY